MKEKFGTLSKCWIWVYSPKHNKQHIWQILFLKMSQACTCSQVLVMSIRAPLHFHARVDLELIRRSVRSTLHISPKNLRISKWSLSGKNSCKRPMLYIYGLQCDFMPKSFWKQSNFENQSRPQKSPKKNNHTPLSGTSATVSYVDGRDGVVIKGRGRQKDRNTKRLKDKKTERQKDKNVKKSN